MKITTHFAKFARTIKSVVSAAFGMPIAAGFSIAVGNVTKILHMVFLTIIPKFTESKLVMNAK